MKAFRAASVLLVLPLAGCIALIDTKGEKNLEKRIEKLEKRIEGLEKQPPDEVQVRVEVLPDNPK